MNKLVLEIGFIELLVAVVGSALMGVLLMLLYHRLAMRREKELHQHRAETVSQQTQALETARTPSSDPESCEPPESVNETSGDTDCLDFHSPKPGS